MSVCCRQRDSCTEMRGEVESVGFRLDLKQVQVTGEACRGRGTASPPTTVTICERNLSQDSREVRRRGYGAINRAGLQ